MKKSIFSIVSVIFCLQLLRSSIVYSQDPIPNYQFEGVVIWPSFKLLSLESGSSQKISTFIKNENDVSLKVDPEYRNVKINENVKNGVLVTSDTASSPAVWLKPETQIPFTIKPKETIEFVSLLNIPQDANNIGYYPAVVFKFSTEDDGNKIISTSEITQLLYLSIADVKGESTQKQLEIRDFSVNKGFLTRSKVQFNIEMRNSGEVHIQPRGAIYVFDPKGIRQQNITRVNDKMVYVLPGQVMSEYLMWEDDTVSKYFPPIGRYRAVLEVYLDESQREKLQEEVTFYVLPGQYIVYGFLILLLLILGFIIVYRRRKLRSDRN